MKDHWNLDILECWARCVKCFFRAFKDWNLDILECWDVKSCDHAVKWGYWNLDILECWVLKSFNRCKTTSTLKFRHFGMLRLHCHGYGPLPLQLKFRHFGMLRPVADVSIMCWSSYWNLDILECWGSFAATFDFSASLKFRHFGMLSNKA